MSDQEVNKKPNCKKCNDKGWYYVDEYIGNLPGRKDCNCRPTPSPAAHKLAEIIKKEK